MNSSALGECLICGEESSGKHYGVYSCLSCKTFFRRAVVHEQDINCKRNGKCELDKNARKACRACRYKKCLASGMSKAALQPRRDLIGCRRLPGQKNGNLRNVNLSPNCSKGLPNSSVESQQAKMDRIAEQTSLDNTNFLEVILKLTKIDKDIRKRKFQVIHARDEAKKLSDGVNLHVNGKQGAVITSSKDASSSSTSSPVEHFDKSSFHRPLHHLNNSQLRIMLGIDIANVCHIELLSLIEWSRKLPAFSILKSVDQLTLLKRFAMHYLIIEHGYYTAQFDVENVWLISNGTCMPRNINVIGKHGTECISEERKWRQEKLYKQMTDRCIDEVAQPLRRLNLMPEELLTLKLIMLYHCGNHTHVDESSEFISQESRRVICDARNNVINALFQFYKHIKYENYEERFGNVILLISGVVSAATAVQESYQIMRLFKIVTFDHLAEELLFHLQD
uniref:Nuclear receptor domain-containing protein n=1 Tax=Rhabditophanes sp. KR3021 TaxID=114890 RepID=A0AC35U4U1_9BILA